MVFLDPAQSLGLNLKLELGLESECPQKTEGVLGEGFLGNGADGSAL